MSTIPRSYAKAGGKSSAERRSMNDSLVSSPFNSPFDVLKSGFRREEVPKAERTVTASGTVRVEFTEKRKTVSRSASGDAARAPKFDVAGDHALPPDTAERLSALPGRRYGPK